MDLSSRSLDTIGSPPTHILDQGTLLDELQQSFISIENKYLAIGSGYNILQESPKMSRLSVKSLNLPLRTHNDNFELNELKSRSHNDVLRIQCTCNDHVKETSTDSISVSSTSFHSNSYQRLSPGLFPDSFSSHGGSSGSLDSQYSEGRVTPINLELCTCHEPCTCNDTAADGNDAADAALPLLKDESDFYEEVDIGSTASFARKKSGSWNFLNKIKKEKQKKYEVRTKSPKHKKLKKKRSRSSSGDSNYVVHRTPVLPPGKWVENPIKSRIKVCFLGSSGCGKTSLVHSLIGDSADIVDTPTEGVNQQLWYPFKNTQHENLLDFPLSPEERLLVLDIWDMSGREVYQGCHQCFITPGALFVIVFDISNQESCDAVPAYVDTIQAKAPGSCFLLISSKADKIASPEKLKVRQEAVLLKLQDHVTKQLNEIQAESGALRCLKESMLVNSSVLHLETVLEKEPKLPNHVISTSSLTAMGLDDLRKEILIRALDFDLYPHLTRQVHPLTVQLYDKILKMRQNGEILLTWQQYKALTNEDGRKHDEEMLEKEVDFLQTVGAIEDFKFQAVENTSSDKDSGYYGEVNNHGNHRVICIDPIALLNLMCAVHVDDDKKAFKFEANRFWPKRSSVTRPDPSQLVKALEEIPMKGAILEVLCPLLWQTKRLNGEQTENLLSLFQHLHIMVPYLNSKTDYKNLMLPNYPRLSTEQYYYAPLLQLIPDNKPQLNWTQKPLKGDFQICWRYNFISKVPPGFLARAIACCKDVKVKASYEHYWKNGVLLRLDEVFLCVFFECDHGATSLSISGRANAEDSPGEEQEVVKLIWVNLSLYIKTLDVFMAEWPGLAVQIELIPVGEEFFFHKQVEEHSFSLLKCLSFWKSREKFIFQDNGETRELNLECLFPFIVESYQSVSDWIDHILSKRQQIIGRWMALNQDTPPDTPVLPKVVISQPTNNKATKKNVAIKWKLEDDGNSESEKDSSYMELDEVTLTTSDTEPNANPMPQNSIKKSTQMKLNQVEPITDSEKSEVITSENTVEDISNKTDPPDPQSARISVLIDEEKEIQRVASGFVAAVLASAVAEYISVEFQDNHKFNHMITAAQVEAAKITAQASMATHSGDPQAAANAVMAAASTMHSALEKAKTETQLNNRSHCSKCTCVVS